MALSFCVVCGRPSTRGSWPNTGTVNGISYVACDFHSLVTILTCAIDSGGVPANAGFYGPQNDKNTRKSIPERGQ